MPIDFSDPRPAYQQIADDLRGKIKDGRIKLGERLPSRKDLAKHYDVAPETVRKAQSELANDGLISTQSTRGVYVIKTPEEPEPSQEYRQVMAELQRLTERVGGLESRVRALEDQ
ncbi:GntR family transcriptional regulator [Nonomuraea sp. SYSU D8015]|uniref:GntR family transcriptional regulator n=1 Tax=Nonomuraea sp. SYSU D8015 TaxID=2593644 RepID=UPI00166152F5|nr:GntR family transcriptional regulator [Nonomuraea sp. SYSU D8015]